MPNFTWSHSLIPGFSSLVSGCKQTMSACYIFVLQIGDTVPRINLQWKKRSLHLFSACPFPVLLCSRERSYLTKIASPSLSTADSLFLWTHKENENLATTRERLGQPLLKVVLYIPLTLKVTGQENVRISFFL